jgi:hypothetical protein
MNAQITPYTIILGDLDNKRRSKMIQIRKEEVKIPLFADDMTVYLSDPKTSPENSYS